MEEEFEQLRRERDSLAAKLAAHEQEEAIAKDIAKALQTALARMITDRLPLELVPDTDDLPSALTALASGFKLKQQPDGSMALNPYVFEFARAVAAQAVRDWGEQYERKYIATGVAVRDAMDYANQLEAGE